MNTMKFYPTLFNCGTATEVQTYLDRLHQAEAALADHEVTTVQVDIIDGQFADNITVTPLDLVECDFGELKCDLHLMVDEPMDMVFEAISVKNQLPIRAVIGQVEHMSYQEPFIEEVRQQGWLPGLSLDLHTPLEAIELASWEHLKVIQIMGNQAGYGGQPLKPQAIELLKQVVEYVRRQHLEVEILVDIGVNAETIPSLLQAGATGGAVGTALWQAASLEEGLAALRAAVESTK